ncbi:MAG: hypothetical protein ABJA33_11435, partial [Pedococcus sp.]
ALPGLQTATTAVAHLLEPVPAVIVARDSAHGGHCPDPQHADDEQQREHACRDDGDGAAGRRGRLTPETTPRVSTLLRGLVWRGLGLRRLGLRLLSRGHGPGGIGGLRHGGSSR